MRKARKHWFCEGIKSIWCHGEGHVSKGEKILLPYLLLSEGAATTQTFQGGIPCIADSNLWPLSIEIIHTNLSVTALGLRPDG